MAEKGFSEVTQSEIFFCRGIIDFEFKLVGHIIDFTIGTCSRCCLSRISSHM